MMDSYLVRPFDVIYFRGNKSFDFGEWYSEGVFPPYPSTFQGFVRTAILKQNNLITSDGKLVNKDEATRIVGDDETMPFEIRGPYLYHSSEFYVPAPYDVLPFEGKKAKQIELSETALMSDLGYKMHFANFKVKSKFLDWNQSLCSLSDLNNFRVKGEINQKDEDDKTNLIETENHVGIQLDYGNRTTRKKQAKESLFYMTPYIRFHEQTHFYFGIDLNGVNLENVDNKLGSEGRAAICAKFNTSINFQMADSIYEGLIKDRQFKLILMQPGLFKNGWLPFEIDEPEDGFIVLKYNNMRLQLLYARTAGVKKISGMSIRKQKANTTDSKFGLKPMLNAVPAGAVYYFKILDPLPEKPLDILKALDGSKIDAPDEKFSKMGFNQVVIGKIICKSFEANN